MLKVASYLMIFFFLYWIFDEQKGRYREGFCTDPQLGGSC